MAPSLSWKLSTCIISSILTVVVSGTPQTLGPGCGWTHQGCFYYGNTTRPLEFQIVPSKTEDTTRENCQAICEQTSGYLYAGVAFGWGCYCGNSLSATPNSESYCNEECYGDHNEFCGGFDSMNIFVNTCAVVSSMSSSVATSSTFSIPLPPPTSSVAVPTPPTFTLGPPSVTPVPPTVLPPPPPSTLSLGSPTFSPVLPTLGPSTPSPPGSTPVFPTLSLLIPSTLKVPPTTSPSIWTFSFGLTIPTKSLPPSTHSVPTLSLSLSPPPPPATTSSKTPVVTSSTPATSSTSLSLSISILTTSKSPPSPTPESTISTKLPHTIPTYSLTKPSFSIPSHTKPSHSKPTISIPSHTKPSYSKPSHSKPPHTTKYTVSTVSVTKTYTISSCHSTVKSCPYGSTTKTVSHYTTLCPVTTSPTPTPTSKTIKYTTSTISTTKTYTITSCAPSITKCHIGSTTTTVSHYTTICPVTTPPPPPPPPTTIKTVKSSTQYTTTTIYTKKTYTITSCHPTVTKCPIGSITVETSSLYTTTCPVSSNTNSGTSTTTLPPTTKTIHLSLVTPLFTLSPEVPEETSTPEGSPPHAGELPTEIPAGSLATSKPLAPPASTSAVVGVSPTPAPAPPTQVSSALGSFASERFAIVVLSIVAMCGLVLI